MGFLRLALSGLVMLSHLAWAPSGYNPGVFAVIVFFLISGFVMTALVSKHYDRPRLAPAFYGDRCLRLYPQYVVYLTLAILTILFLRPDDSLSSEVSVSGIALNFLMIPNDFWTLILPHSIYIPPAWSLGLEATFYLVFPFIFIFKLRLPFVMFSLIFFAAAYCGWLDTDLWGYRWLPGTLFIFLSGSAIYSARDETLPRLPFAIWAAAILALLWILLRHRYQVPFNVEVLTGLLLGIPVVWLLRWQPSNIFDRWAGNLSYGVFLNHYLLIWICKAVGLQGLRAVTIATLTVASLAASALTYYFVEAPLIARRRALRENKRLVPATSFGTAPMP